MWRVSGLWIACLINGIHGPVVEPYDYPTYCAKAPWIHEARQSPPLDPVDRNRSLELEQVHLIFRHGARAPATTSSCWKGYLPHWDCEYEEISLGMAPLDLGTLAFVRRFDADVEANFLGGTCQKGQLLAEGAKQHKQIGYLLAKNYFCPNDAHKIPRPSTASLIASLQDVKELLYVRSTDMQRTRLSASHLISSLLLHAFEERNVTEIQKYLPPMHFVDRDRDYLAVNPARCPEVSKAADRALISAEFRALQFRYQDLVRRLEVAIGMSLTKGMWPDRILDCIMSHVCGDRWNDIPDGLSPNGTHPESSRQLIIDAASAVDEVMSFLHLYDGSTYSKLGISFFMGTLRNQLKSIGAPDSPRLLVWSGHDSTILPFLAAFGDGVFDKRWPPYASLITMEIFSENGEFLFRMIYNGRVVTGGIQGCLAALCNVKQFLTATEWAEEMVEICVSSWKGGLEAALTRPNWPQPYPSAWFPGVTRSVTVGLQTSALLLGVAVTVIAWIAHHVSGYRTISSS